MAAAAGQPTRRIRKRGRLPETLVLRGVHAQARWPPRLSLVPQAWMPSAAHADCGAQSRQRSRRTRSARG
eukprot:scaffold267188_cov32-Tisochrysis_lutea.AAC.4